MELTTTTILTALEQKWRFPSKRGPLTIEDLFDLPLTKNNGLNLDTVAIEINNQLVLLNQQLKKRLKLQNLIQCLKL